MPLGHSPTPPPSTQPPADDGTLIGDGQLPPTSDPSTDPPPSGVENPDTVTP